jgi:hypothetical protein
MQGGILCGATGILRFPFNRIEVFGGDHETLLSHDDPASDA